MRRVKPQAAPSSPCKLPRSDTHHPTGGQAHDNQPYSNAEQQARIDLAACYRLVDLYGMSDMILNHITVRVPDEKTHFLINPFGLMYHEITASSLIKVALDLDERQRLVDDLGDNDVMILRNHGLLTVGVTVAEAFVNMLRLLDQRDASYKN